MNIQIEKNYKAFKFLKGNRPLVPGKVKKLEKSVLGGLNLFKYCPILVNEQMFVIDGQHRLEACKILKLPVYYVMVEKISLLQIAELNDCASKWKTTDFFNCFIETGNDDYVTLQKFCNKHGLAVSIAAALLMYGSASEGGNAVENFRAGKFKVNHPEKANKIMKHVTEYTPVAEDVILKDRSFIRAIQLLMSCDKYVHGEVVAKLVSKKYQLSKKSTYKDYILHIEEQYNRGNSIRRIIYENASKKNAGKAAG